MDGSTAAAATANVVSGLGTALTTIQGDMISAVTTIAPIALAVVGAILVWRFGVRFFKSIAK